MMNKFDESLLRVISQIWEQHQFAKVEYNLLVDLYKKKPNQNPKNECIMLAIKEIYDATGKFHALLEQFN